ncbi:MAG: DNA polymerase III subunit alpha [Deltaproteobacteria bacterium]|nr:DNA polymerase III subunit alpha [Deltaproteobacteria bacterium]
MWGVSSVDELCRAAVESGATHLALTDTNGFYGLINFLAAAKAHSLTPLVGAYIQTASEAAVILIKTLTGYEILSELITRRHLVPDFSLKAEFPACREHLAVMSDDPVILQALRSRAECWVEVVHGPVGRRAWRLSRDLGLPAVATNAVYFAGPEEYSRHRLVRAIDLNRTLSTLPPDAVVSPGQWLQPEEDMRAHFPYCPEAMANTVTLARTLHSQWDHFKPVFPCFDDRPEDHFSRLLALCREGIAWRYGRTRPDIEKRLTEEMDLIRSKGFVDYFLVVADIVKRRLIHCGRGSAAASLVSYLLGITHVDPIRHNLLFGRFLNPQRQDFPDIDVDFPWDERDGLLAEIRDHYGPARMAMVANHIGFQARGAVREVAKVYGIPANRIKEVTKRLGWIGIHGIDQRIENHPKFQDFSLPQPWPEILQSAAGLAGLPRHLSVHCGGVILAPDRISRYVPAQRAAKGVNIIQWEKDQAEEAGLIKIDLLGNRSLAVIRDALAAVANHTGRKIDYARFNPLDDPATLRLLSRGESMGVFYVESPAMRQLQQKTRRGDFEHLVIHSSIIRPAANRYINEYIRRLHGAPYRPLHPSLTRLLSETYGIMVYQEDVVKVAMAMARFDWAAADGLRKTLSKKGSEKLAQYRTRFFDGCAGRGVSAEVAAQVWDMIISFAGYSFCKPHSASYALVSFKSAYLKAHYPAEFMAAVISNQGGYYTTSAYISEARRMGVTVLGPDINASDWAYLGRDRTIRVGLQQLKGIRQEIIESILAERGGRGPFTALDDVMARVKLCPEDISILSKSGALDSLANGFNRPQVRWYLEARLGRETKSRPLRSPQSSFHLTTPQTRTQVPPLPDISLARKCAQEVDTLGFVLSVHPLKLFESFFRSCGQVITPAAELAGKNGRRVTVKGWPISRKEVATREGEPMQFFSFEDETAIYETVFFPKAFKRFCQYLDMDRPHLLTGRVQTEYGAVSLTVDRITRVPTIGTMS